MAIAGWLCGVALVFIGWKKIPEWVKNRQAAALSDPEDVARVALSTAVKEDVLPEIRTQIGAIVTAAEARIGQVVGAVEKRLVLAVAEAKADVEAVKADFQASKANLDALQPLARVVTVKMEDGTEREALALQMTLNSTIEALNGLIDWISEPSPDKPGLTQTFETALVRVKEYDVMAAMGAKGNEAQRAAAEKLGLQAAQKLQWMQAHPDMAQAGVELQQVEDALGEILGMMGVKDGAIKSYAMNAAKRSLAGQAMQGGLPAPGSAGTAYRPPM